MRGRAWPHRRRYRGRSVPCPPSGAAFRLQIEQARVSAWKPGAWGARRHPTWRAAKAKEFVEPLRSQSPSMYLRRGPGAAGEGALGHARLAQLKVQGRGHSNGYRPWPALGASRVSLVSSRSSVRSAGGCCNVSCAACSCPPPPDGWYWRRASHKLSAPHRPLDNETRGRSYEKMLQNDWNQIFMEISYTEAHRSMKKAAVRRLFAASSRMRRHNQKS